jgi:hypothetical protein
LKTVVNGRCRDYKRRQRDKSRIAAHPRGRVARKIRDHGWK